ncbi:hypothetical protein CTRI78_v002764 [Colletotrichum trifolii]|uniref:Uncharacterized protein n=1 Tax=Colletotrichum trifolii TaxID=5466 RepID=A0A4R8RL07_COLTR|nr:hypothetical protein CTRI78_v002764 [Colletotrichum trifolii]
MLSTAKRPPNQLHVRSMGHHSDKGSRESHSSGSWQLRLVALGCAPAPVRRRRNGVLILVDFVTFWTARPTRQYYKRHRKNSLLWTLSVRHMSNEAMLRYRESNQSWHVHR